MGGGAALRHLAAVYDSFDAHVERSRAEFKEEPDPATKAGAVTAMREHLMAAKRLQKSLAWVDSITIPPLDLGTNYFVEQAARRLVATDAEIVVVSAGDSSYATYSNPFRRLIKAWGDPSTISGDNLIVIFLPRRERRSGLLHPLLVHELGHAACQGHKLTSRAIKKAVSRQRVQKRFRRLIEEMPKGAQLEMAISVRARLRYWIEEALCDALATQYLGPTYLFAFLAEVVAGNVDHPGEKHPPPRQRVRLMLTQLEKLSWKSTMTYYADDCYGWLRETADVDVPYSGVEKFLVWVLKTIANDIHRLVEVHAKNHTFTLAPGELSEVTKLVALGVPPAQRLKGQAVDSRAVLLGCWLYALKDSGGDIEGVPKAIDKPELAELLPTGLEMAALLRAWR